MNLREIDRLVAEKVMDWVQGEYAKDKWYYKKNGQIHGMAKFVKDWNPSTNIADAWQVAEKLMKNGLFFNVLKWIDGDFVARFENHKVSVKAEAETAPLAICLAALKSVGVEVDN